MGGGKVVLCKTEVILESGSFSFGGGGGQVALLTCWGNLANFDSSLSFNPLNMFPNQPIS